MKPDIHTQNLMLSNKDFEMEKNFWLDYLRGDIIMGRFPADYPELRSSGARKENITIVFPDDLFSRITSNSKHSEYGTYIFLISGLFFLLSKYTGVQDITIGIPAFTPSDGEYLEQILGLRCQIQSAETFKDSLYAIRDRVNQVRKFQYFPFGLVAKTLNLMTPDSSLTLFPTVVLMENIQDQKCLEGVHPDTLISFRLSDRDLTLKLEYDADLYQKESFGRLIHHLFNFYYAVTVNPGVKLAEIGILTEEERQCIVSQFNSAKLEYPRWKTIHQLFEEQVEKNPGNIALEIGESQLTYGELNRSANQLARNLRLNNIIPGSIVGIMAERSLELIIGIIAILKAGAAYLPIDPEYPGDRIQYMLKNSNTAILLTQSHLTKPIDFFDKIMDLNDERLYTGDDSNLEPLNTSKDLVYVIYTSGSTGKPKGVMIEHCSLVNFLFCIADKFGGKIGAEDNCLSLTNIAFDVSVAEIFLPLVFGARLVFPETQQVFDIRELSRTIAAKSITFAYIPPMVLKDALHCLESMKANISLNKMLVGVESIKDYVLEDYYKFNNSIIIINGYGPTESTICATFFIYQSKNPEGKNVPIGRPLANLKIYIVDEMGQPVPMGIAGELWISGDGLARGYINHPELTAEKFVEQRHVENQEEQLQVENQEEQLQVESCMLHVENQEEQLHVESCMLHVENQEDRLQVESGKLNADLQQPSTFNLQPSTKVYPSTFNLQPSTSLYPSTRFYRTGDLARWLPDGNIEFLGRRDQQVKIRGFRIELGEIESHLLHHPLIKEVIVLTRENEGVKSLCAYLAPAGQVKAAELREYLALHLPEYMIPSYFVFLDKIPMTANGKVDRNSLPDPKTGIDSGVVYLPPRTEAEQKMALIWQEVLGVEKVGINDNFFHLGGDSIKALKAAALSEANHLYISVADLLKHLTISGILANTDYQQAKQTGISQAEVSGMVFPTPVQQWFFQLELEHPHYWNQVYLFSLQEDVRVELLEQAMRKIVEHHDALRIGFKIEGGAVIQFNRSVAESDFRLKRVDLAAEDPEKRFWKLAEICEALQDELNPAEDLLLQAGVFDLGSAGKRLWISVHHLVIDTVSWRIVFEDLRRLYESNLMDSLPPKTTSFQEWSRKLQELASSDSMDIDYWRRIDRSRLRTLAGPKKAASYRGEYHDLTLTLAGDKTQSLLTVVHRVYDTGMNDILLTALVMAFNEAAGTDIVLLNLESYGRADVLPGVNLTRTVGWFTAVYPVFLAVKPSITETIMDIKDTLSQIQKTGIGYGICRYLRGQHQELADLNPEISFNYLGQFDTFDAGLPNPWMMIASEEPGWPIHPQNRHPYPLDINSWIAGGRFNLTISYDPARLDELMMRRLGTAFINKLEMVIEHCLAWRKDDHAIGTGFFPAETNSGSARELPVKMQNEITSYLCHSLPLCVILADERFYPWFYENFVQIYAYGDEDDYVMFDFLERRAPYNDIIQEVYLGYELLEDVTHIVDFVTRKIDLGYYLIVHVDEYYLPEKQTYQQQHYVHHSLVYGYDPRQRKLKAVGFDASHIFTYLTFDYDQFAAAFENGKHYYQEAAPWAKTNAIELLRPRPYPGAYPFELKKFIQKLDDYLEAKGDPAIIYTFERDPQKVRFGIGLYDALQENFQLLKQGVVKIDYRAMHLLSEHKYGLLNRFKFIRSRYGGSDELTRLIGEYEPIVALVESARKIYFEQTFTGAVNGYYNPLPEILALERMMEIIQTAKLREQKLMTSIRERLRKLI